MHPINCQTILYALLINMKVQVIILPKNNLVRCCVFKLVKLSQDPVVMIVFFYTILLVV